jgi:glycerol uptake facilitator-like aquaporin
VRCLALEGFGTAVLVVTACLATTSPSVWALPTVAAMWGALRVAGRSAGRPGPFLHPALTAAAWVTGRLRTRALVALLAAQSTGTAVGIPLAVRATEMAMTGAPGVASPAELPDVVAPIAAHALAVEAVVVAVLTVVALSAATPHVDVPLALVAGVAAVLVAAVSGAAFNPAIAVALAHTGVLPWELAVAYVPAHLAGALVAALVVAGMPSARPTPLAGPVGVPRQRQVADAVPRGSSTVHAH